MVDNSNGESGRSVRSLLKGVAIPGFQVPFASAPEQSRRFHVALYASASGLDPKQVLLSIGGGSAASWQLSSNAPRMLDGDFNPGFYAKHFLKDLRIALDSSKTLGLSLPLVVLAENLFAKVLAQGWGERGTQVLYELYRRGLV